MVVQGTLCLEGCDNDDGDSWRVEQVCLDRTLKAMSSYLSSVAMGARSSLGVGGRCGERGSVHLNMGGAF